MPEYKEPVAKLPLVARKSWRDEFDSKKPQLEERLLELLGTAWTIKADPNFLFAYAEPDSYSSNNLGGCVFSYFESGVDRIKDFVSEGSYNHGPEGAAELNTLASSHVFTLLPDLTGTVNYCGAVIDEGELRMVFNPKCLGTNIYDALSKLPEALSAASEKAGTPLSYAARHDIKDKWEKQAEELTKKIGEQLHDSIKLVPDFEANYAKLKACKSAREDWQQHLGDFTFGYFDSVLYKMSSDKFIEDDLLREGFAESVTKGEIVFRIVDKLAGTGSSYNECLIEDGRLILQTKPSEFGTNLFDTASKLVEQL